MRKILILVALVFIVVSCGKNNKGLVIEGHILNAEKEALYLSSLGAQNVTLLDSVKLNQNGKFKFSVPVSKYPEFYFLKTSGETLTLLADSVHHISVESEMPGLLQHASIKGSKESELILEVDKKLKALRVAYRNYREAWDKFEQPEDRQDIVDNIVSEIDAYKKEAGQMVMDNPRSFVGYYILYQRLDDAYSLFNPYDDNDFKYFGALATSLNIYYPNAPRTKALYAKVEDAIRLQRTERFEKMIEQAKEGLPDIALPDVNGDTIKLSSLKGKTVILNYWLSTNETSRVSNRLLKQVYKKYRRRGVEIYQCSLDKSKVLWEIALEEDGVSWPSVCDFKGGSSKAVWMYNVQEVPTNYLINNKGQVVGKYNDPIELEKKLNELL